MIILALVDEEVLVSSVIFIFSGLSLRSRLSFIFVFGSVVAIRERNLVKLFSGLSLRLVIISFVLTFVFVELEFGNISLINALRCTLRLKVLAISVFISVFLMFNKSRLILLKSISCCVSVRVILLGMVNLISTFSSLGVRIVVLMLINLSLRFNSVSSELSRLMEVFVWIKFFRFLRFNSLRFNAEIMLEVAVCLRLNGLSIVTVKLSTRNLSESVIAICVNLFGF